MHGASLKLRVFALAGVLVGMAGTVERAAAGGQEVARRAQNSAAAQPIEVIPTSVAFENVPVGDVYTQPVRVTNLSNGRLRVTSVTSSTGEFVVRGITLPMDLEAGDNVTFTVAYKPRAARGIAGRLSITTDLNATPTQIEVKATAASKELGLSASAASVDFGVVAIGTRNTRELELENGGNTDVTVSKISVSSENFSVGGGSALKLAPGQKTTVQLQFDPASVGSRNGVVSIISDSLDSPLQIAVSGTGAAKSGHSVELKWEESLTSVAGYNVYRASESDGSYTKLEASPIATASYTDTGLAVGHTYFYIITAVDANNAESEVSAQISVTVPEG